MKILIVTATRGDSAWFDATLESICALRKRGVPLFWVVIGPAGKIEARPEIDRVLEERGRGLYVALNQAIREMSDENWTHFSYINDDDGFADGFVNLVRATEGGGADILYGDVDYVNEAGGYLGQVSICSKFRHLQVLFSKDIAPFTQQGVVVSRAVMDALGGFSNTLKLAADTDFFVRALIGGFKFKYIPATAAFYRIRAGQLSNNTELMGKEREAVAQLAKQALGRAAPAWFVVARFRLVNLARTLNRRRLTGWVSTERMFSGK